MSALVTSQALVALTLFVLLKLEHRSNSCPNHEELRRFPAFRLGSYPSDPVNSQNAPDALIIWLLFFRLQGSGFFTPYAGA